ncbi:MAG TPA: glycosyltransferase [Verrucomicrobiae bacterium]|nr:glycosyltransferase [Verrucomicrobiae bacterium]
MPIHVRAKQPKPQPVTQASSMYIPQALPIPPAGHPQKPAGVSLCMIVKNEEKFLPQALASIKDYVDEIVIADTGSTDRTIEIARSYGATVIERPWRNDFSWARNESINLATKRWILFLDADEELTEDSRPALLALKNVPAYLTALYTRIINKTDDYRGSGDVSHHVIRIFPNDDRIRFFGPIHEYPAIDGTSESVEAVASSVTLIHHGYVNTVVAERNKGQRNLEILLAATQNDSENAYHWYNLGTTAYLNRDYDLALRSLEKMYALVGDTPRAFMPNGLALMGDLYCDHFGDAVKGEEMARQSLKRSPHYANAHMMLGKALIAQKRHEEAREAFAAAIEDKAYAKQQFIVDDQVYIWKAFSEMGSSYSIEGNDAKSLEWFEKGLANAPTVEPLMINRAKALERLKRFGEAFDAYKLVLDTHESMQGMLHFVNFLLRMKRGAEAIALVEKWYPQLKPAEASELLVSAAGVSERYELGKEEHFLRLAVELDPDSEKALAQLERVLRERGNDGDLEAVRELQAPKTFDDWKRRAHRALDEKRAEAALNACEAALEIDPKSFDILMTRAGALELLLSPAGVEASLMRAREIDPVRSTVALSLFYLRNERFADAAAITEGMLK